MLPPLDVSFGIFAFLPQGWMFMLLIIALECWLMSRFLVGKPFDRPVWGTVLISNVVSGLTGIVTTMVMNGGWYLTVWFPWVSGHEINLADPEQRRFLLLFYLAAFALSVLIECVLNLLLLRNRHRPGRVLSGTLLVNVASYLFGTLVMYAYSFSAYFFPGARTFF